MVTHPIKLYETLVTGQKGISPILKFYALKQGIKSLLLTGRVVLSAGYAEAINPINFFCIGRYAFETIYIGRRAIWRRGLRHIARKKYKDFLMQPIKIPYSR